MSQQTRKATRDLSDLFELVVKAMICIVVVFLIAKALIPLIVGPGIVANIISYILGIALLFAIVVSKRVRSEILSFGKSK